ncbi:D-2-hydroxyacid dehydrogenase [Pigmentiphaga litoralis]|uniref:Phosphoglycerate dehydrogenase-like enzyme n=1 Tax=Pigmentiphaga litoralis TaxID=516702 RepID=A0A7Y9IYY8_9BURK|nr:D-2-hydroxyacid dehydrogenase [Pigmentiphaga litoralis]NYE85597.1 phosphoglycerate dehydrogenase-like enzyme [Pigmentiphaga litoralis]
MSASLSAPMSAHSPTDDAQGPASLAPGNQTLLIVNADAAYYAAQLMEALAQPGTDAARPDATAVPTVPAPAVPVAGPPATATAPVTRPPATATVTVLAATPGQPLPEGAEAATAVMGFASALTPALITQLPHLRWLHALSSGVDGIVSLPNLPAGLVMTSSHGVHGPAVSELTLMLMLSLARDFPSLIDNQRAHLWKRRPQPLLHGKTVVILGTGLIARALATRCRALGMRTVAVTATVRELPEFDMVLARSDLLDGAAQADMLVALAPLDDTTKGMVDASVFAAMKPTACFINVARAGLCDTAALVDALTGGRLAGAALDVFEREPLPADDPLWDVPRLLITPHLGGESDRYADQVLPIIVHNTRCALQGRWDAMRNRIALPA